MYNGVGLKTVRGSASSGFVQKSNAFVAPRNSEKKSSNHNGAEKRYVLRE
jgi:hypothetical protein